MIRSLEISMQATEYVVRSLLIIVLSLMYLHFLLEHNFLVYFIMLCHVRLLKVAAMVTRADIIIDFKKSQFSR